MEAHNASRVSLSRHQKTKLFSCGCDAVSVELLGLSTGICQSGECVFPLGCCVSQNRHVTDDKNPKAAKTGPFLAQAAYYGMLGSHCFAQEHHQCALSIFVLQEAQWSMYVWQGEQSTDDSV